MEEEVRFKLRSNGEVEAVDMLAEAGAENLKLLLDTVEEKSLDRICLYLLRYCPLSHHCLLAPL